MPWTFLAVILAAVAFATTGDATDLAAGLVIAGGLEWDYPFRPYQARWLRDVTAVKVFAKSRQIGITWTTAFEAVMVASARAYEQPGFGMDVFIMSISADEARLFVEECAKWIRRLRPMIEALREASEIEEGDWLRTDDNDEEIQAFRIRFPSGFAIYGLPSKPSRLRGRHGYLIVDEAAQQDLREIRRAASAFRVHMGRFAYISTYLGAENDFYRLVEEARASDRMALHEVSLTDALDEAYFTEIIARQHRIPPTPEAEAEWVEGLREIAGEFFDEEFLLIVDQAGGQEIPRALVQRNATLGPDECTVIEVVARRGKPSRLVVNGAAVAVSSQPWDDADLDSMRAEVERWLDLYLSPTLARLSAEGLDLHAGLDYGKERDLSATSILQRTRTNQRRLRLHIELEHVPWPIQDLISDYIWPRIIGRLRSGCGDMGGPGAASVDRARILTGGKIVGISINEQWHATAWTRLRKRFEEGSMQIMRHHTPLEDDLASIQRRQGKIRPPKSRPGARGQTRHADAAVALALAEQSIEHDPVATIAPPPSRKVYSRADLARAQRRRRT